MVEVQSPTPAWLWFGKSALRTHENLNLDQILVLSGCLGGGCRTDGVLQAEVLPACRFPATKAGTVHVCLWPYKHRWTLSWDIPVLSQKTSTHGASKANKELQVPGITGKEEPAL